MTLSVWRRPKAKPTIAINVLYGVECDACGIDMKEVPYGWTWDGNAACSAKCANEIEEAI